MAAAETDADVIAGSLDQGERFETIFDRHAASIHRYLRGRVGERLAEELTAETFTRAFRARRQFDTSHTSALPWLYGIATNLVRMHLRSGHRRRRAYRLFAFTATPSEPSLTSEADERLDARALGPALREALAALTADQSEVLLLHAWAGLSHAEIGEALCISPAIARQRLHRARANAAKRLERHGKEQIESVLQTRATR
jgi:RNA polymerase sigma factor (sigma-70 family)